ncbi:TetR/AcrR family transcriptional regulator [Microbacterium stercoris]|uniref:TetR/AcrR family transcriptional regulator n=1 Tax=Microbacterium stercoris TaxID=2820289 RepID=UPI0027DC84FF|nr:TetR/AcrR family transcriptional regulator C-terminal ligand-binding domain-containing protein [Microbacterium stercoris]
MSEQETPPRRGRGRRPADEVRTDVYNAVGELLLSEGMADLTFERVARIAGVSKTTLYRWWPSVGVLALDCYKHAVETRFAFPDTGDIRTDLLTQMTSFADVMTHTPGGRILAELIGASQTDPELSATYRELYSSERRALAVARLEIAQQAGQIREGVDLRVLVDQLWGAIYHRVLIPDEPVDEAFITALVDNLLGGVAPR